MPPVTSRRAFLRAAAAALLLPRAGRARTAPAARIDAITTISQQPALYHGWPTVARRRSGELLVVCSGGREAHVCPFGRVELMRSHDEGATWTWPEIVMDGPIDDRDAGVVETASGAILITSFSSLAYEPILQRAMADGNWPADRLRRWQAAHERVDAASRQAALGVWMIRSADSGVTWSARYDPLVDSPHGPIQLDDGRLLYAGKDLWRGENRTGVAESLDDGVSWRWLAAIPTRPGDDHHAYHELHAVEAQGGRLVLQLRNHNEANARETLQCESADGGRTWSEPRAIGVWGLPSHLLRLRDGRLLMSYGYRRAPFGNQARASEDGGRTWSDPITLSDDGIGGDLGYPSTVQIGDRSLLTVWYERMADSDRAALRQARWTLEA